MPNIAIVADRWSPRSHEVTRGIHDFVLSANDWQLERFEADEFQLGRALVTWGATAVVLYLEGHNEPDALLAELQQTRLPVVVISSQLRWQAWQPLARVALSRTSIASLLAQHLQSLPLDRVGLCVVQPDVELASALSAQFGTKFEQLELKLSLVQLRATQPQPPIELIRWLSSSGHLVLLAQTEQIATYLRRLANCMNLQVPKDVSLISLVDSLDCALPSHSVTSVLQPDRECGYQAARLVHRALGKLPIPVEPMWVDAVHMTCRATSVESGQDLAIVRAIKFIEENATRGITVTDVMNFQQTSRVTFERQFLLALGCTPGEYIRKIKVDKAKQLLTETTQSIESVGRTCGYMSPAKFSSFFKRALGVSPATYRSQQVHGENVDSGQDNHPTLPN